MSGLIPKTFINDLLGRLDIVSIIDSRIPLKKTGQNYSACCPFHQEKSPSFTVSPNKQFYHCFGCGAHGTAISFLMEYDRLSFPEAIEALAGTIGLAVPREGSADAFQQHDPLHNALQKASTFYKQQLRQSQVAIQYLKKRGITGEIAAQFDIGYAPEEWHGLQNGLQSESVPEQDLLAAGLIIRNEQGKHYDRFRNRIMFPIHDQRGRIIGFGGRTLDKQEGAKYLNSPETPVFHKGHELYGLYEIRKQRKSPEFLLVVEGYMDVIALAQHGIDNAVATLGTSTTQEHIEKLLRLCREIVFCFDGDPAGKKAAWRALETSLPIVHGGCRIRFLFLPDGEDPDSLIRKEGKEKILQRLQQARNLSDFLFDELTNKTDTASIDGRATLASLAKPLIERVTDPIYKQLLMTHLAQTLGLNEEKLWVPPTPQQSRLQRQETASRSPRNMGLKMNDIRTAIATLLEQPALALNVQNLDTLKTLERPGIGLLFELIEQIRQTPNITTAALLQEYSTSEHEKSLSTLATHEFVLDNDDPHSIGIIFADCMQRLLGKALAQRASILLEKSKPPQPGLTAAEQKELQILLQRRTPPTQKP